MSCSGLSHGWMELDHLAASAGLERAFTIGYRFIDKYRQTEDWTARFNRFKQKDRAALRGGRNLLTTAVPVLVRHLGLDASQTTAFVPALSSRETVASAKGVLPIITRACSEAAKTAFVPDAVTKKAHQPLHRVSDVEKRCRILDGAGYRSGKIEAENIFVFDDFITRGDTLSRIAQAIRETNGGARVFGVALGKNDRHEFFMQRYGIELSNDHVPEKWSNLWDEGEAK